MRDPNVIAREIDHARHDLEASLGELKELVRHKLDLKLRARQAVGRAIERGVDGALTAVRRAEVVVRDHAAIAAIAACAVLALVYVHARRRRR